MDREEHIRRCEKAAETFERTADRADNDPVFKERGWDGSRSRESARRARESAERLRREED
jgi:hypothetical protein